MSLKWSMMFILEGMAASLWWRRRKINRTRKNGKMREKKQRMEIMEQVGCMAGSIFSGTQLFNLFNALGARHQAHWIDKSVGCKRWKITKNRMMVQTQYCTSSDKSHTLNVLNWFEIYNLILYYRLWCQYNTVSFLPNPHNRHPIAHPWGRGMGFPLWVQSLIDILLRSLQCCLWCDILDRTKLYDFTAI